MIVPGIENLNVTSAHMRARKAPSRTRHVREGALRKIYEKVYIVFVRARHLLVHAMFEKGPYEKYMKKYIFFRKAPSRTP